MSDADSDELQLEENEEDELVLEDNADGPLLEDNAAGSDSDDGLVLEHNVGTPGAAAMDEDEDEVTLEENEATVCFANGAEAMPSAERAEALRVEGNSHFRAGRMAVARSAYSAALAVSPPSDNAASATILTNRAAASLQLSDWTAVINDCTAALTLTAIAPETRRKALFRRATAFVQSGDAASARRDLADLPAGDPSVAKLRREMGDAAPAAGLSNRGGSSAAGGRSGGGGVSRGGRGGSAEMGGGSGHCGGGSAARPVSSSGAGAGAGRLVSCIAPTTPERHIFHDCALYRCFSTQTHPAIELIVVDTGHSPSPFFTSPGAIGAPLYFRFLPQHTWMVHPPWNESYRRQPF
jgi:tetratricopeptide (TPR) repeat protein